MANTPRESKLQNNLSKEELQILRKKFEINGFGIQTFANSTLQSRISADSFRIQKKKIGFLSFALLNEGIFRNATIQLFGSSIQSEKGITFASIPMEKALLSLPANRLTSIIAVPVKLDLYNDESLFASITAENATFTIEKDIIVFRDTVQFISKTHRLLSQELYFNVEESLLHVSGQHELNGLKVHTAANYYLPDMHLKDALLPNDTSI